MKFEWHEETGGYWAIAIDAGELIVKSGKPLPYPTWIGTVREEKGKVKVKVWTPAASVPRGYKESATRMMARAVADLRNRHAPHGAAERSALAALRAAKV